MDLKRQPFLLAATAENGMSTHRIAVGVELSHTATNSVSMKTGRNTRRCVFVTCAGQPSVRTETPK